MLPMTDLLINWKSSIPAWKQICERQQGKKGRGKPSTFSQKPAKGSKLIYCVKCATGLKDCACVSVQIGLNP